MAEKQNQPANSAHDPALAMVQALERIGHPPAIVDEAGRAWRVGQREETRLKCLELASKNNWASYFPNRNTLQVAHILYVYVTEGIIPGVTSTWLVETFGREFAERRNAQSEGTSGAR